MKDFQQACLPTSQYDSFVIDGLQEVQQPTALNIFCRIKVPLGGIPEQVVSFVYKISLGNPLYIRATWQEQIQCKDTAPN